MAGGLAAVLAAAPVEAGAAHGHGFPAYAAQRGPSSSGISLDEAVARVRRQTQGKILSAETASENGKKVYRIKVLTPDGRVKRLQIDAGTGQTLPRGY
jgi:uncharacterized membrane protein YkoI